MPRVFASRRFPERVRGELEQSFELTVHDSEWPPERDELLARVAGCDGLMLMLSDRVDDELLDAAGPQLRIAANYAVGIHNVDVEACRRPGVAVSNTPDVLTEATAELTIALMLAPLRASPRATGSSGASRRDCGCGGDGAAGAPLAGWADDDHVAGGEPPAR